jgi:hypothetical protein
MNDKTAVRDALPACPLVIAKPNLTMEKPFHDWSNGVT